MTFEALPSYLGPWQYAPRAPELQYRIHRAVRGAEAILLRVPGALGLQAWLAARVLRAPFGVEVDNVTTFEVRVSIKNPGGELKTNMTANAEIILEEKKDVLLVPESAVVYDRERNTSIEVPDSSADDGKREVAVTLGISNGVKTEVVEGLEEGGQVVLQ